MGSFHPEVFMKSLSLAITSMFFIAALMSCGGGGGGTAAPAAITYTVSGAVTYEGTGLTGVAITFSGSGGTASTNASGSYSVSGLLNGSYTITPSLSGYAFTPASLSVTVSGADQTSQNFIARSLLSDTGQASCYDSTGIAIDCAGTGQDGMYTINTPSYTDNGNNTITDNNTHLVWQKQDNGLTTAWTAANTYCTNNTAALPGTDWRLPTRFELMSIVDYGRSSPSIDPLFTSTATDWYWSSTIYAGDTTQAWYVHFGDGYLFYDDKALPYVYPYVRCVRGAAITGGYADNGNGTIADSATGLLWQKQDDGVTRTWDAALTYCNALSIGVYTTGWRLPNIKELTSTVDDASYDSAINAIFPNSKNKAYWSSTTWTDTKSSAWELSALDGSVAPYEKTFSREVRCVHGQ